MKINEYGRSMVEMLGVLAIMGILTMTGVYGYRIAMRRYQINEISNTAATLLVMAHARNVGEGGCIELSNSNLPNKKPGGVNVEIVARTEPAESIDVQFLDVGFDFEPFCEGLDLNGNCGNTEASCSDEI